MRSYVKEIKKYILDECEKKLMMHGYGKKIEEIIPSFFRILNFDEYRQQLKEKGYTTNKINMIIYRLAGMHRAKQNQQQITSSLKLL